MSTYFFGANLPIPEGSTRHGFRRRPGDPFKPSKQPKEREMAARAKINYTGPSREALDQELSEEKIRARNVLKILSAGIEIFSRKGLDGARIVDIAKASGLPKGNIYYYYSSKERIYDAAIEHLIQSWDEAFEFISADREPEEAIEAYVRAKLDHARENAAETRLFASEILQGGNHLPKEAREHMRRVTAEKAKVIDAWAKEGKIEKIDPRHLFILLWSATQFYADFETLACDALRVRQLRAADFKLAAKAITQTVLKGLLPRQADSPSLDQ